MVLLLAQYWGQSWERHLVFHLGNQWGHCLARCWDFHWAQHLALQ